MLSRTGDVAPPRDFLVETFVVFARRASHRERLFYCPTFKCRQERLQRNLRLQSVVYFHPFPASPKNSASSIFLSFHPTLTHTAHLKIQMLSLPTLFLSAASITSVLGAASSASPSTHAHSHATPTGASNAASTSAAAAVPAAPAATSAVDRSSEQGEAQIKDPFQECSYYSYPPVTEIVSHFLSPW